MYFLDTPVMWDQWDEQRSEEGREHLEVARGNENACRKVDEAT